MVAQVVALGLTPFMVPNYEYIPQMNITWFVVATLGLTICLLKVNLEYRKHWLTILEILSNTETFSFQISTVYCLLYFRSNLIIRQLLQVSVQSWKFSLTMNELKIYQAFRYLSQKSKCWQRIDIFGLLYLVLGV